jgi:uncharacterized membrane protein
MNGTVSWKGEDCTMPEYDRTVTVTTDADKVYAFLADPQNLPQYVATMVMARRQGSDHLHVAADVQGRHEEGDAAFRPDPSGRRIEWGAEDGHLYSGWLAVTPDDTGSSVHLHLHVPEAREVPEVGRALDGTMSNIQRLLGNG